MLGGVAGHAGLFSTAEDLAIYAQMMIGGGEYDGVRILAPRTVATMTRGYKILGGSRSTMEGVPPIRPSICAASAGTSAPAIRSIAASC